MSMFEVTTTICAEYHHSDFEYGTLVVYDRDGNCLRIHFSNDLHLLELEENVIAQAKVCQKRIANRFKVKSGRKRGG